MRIPLHAWHEQLPYDCSQSLHTIACRATKDSVTRVSTERLDELAAPRYGTAVPQSHTYIVPYAHDTHARMCTLQLWGTHACVKAAWYA